MRVAILDLASANPAGAATELGPEDIGILPNVASKAGCEAATETMLARFGCIDMLFNNAGITQLRKTLDKRKSGQLHWHPRRRLLALHRGLAQ